LAILLRLPIESGDRSCLHDEETPGFAGPLDVLGMSVVLLDLSPKLGQLPDFGVAQLRPATLGGGNGHAGVWICRVVTGCTHELRPRGNRPPDSQVGFDDVKDRDCRDDPPKPYTVDGDLALSLVTGSRKSTPLTGLDHALYWNSNAIER
jgi:hypothetical protein